MAKNIIPQGTTAAIKQRVNKYEETREQRMIEVLQSNVKYADALGFIEGEIKQSKENGKFQILAALLETGRCISVEQSNQ